MKKFILKLLMVILFFALAVILALVASYRGDIPFEELAEKYTDDNSFFMNVDGVNVHVKVRGEGEPIFLIHGSFSSLHTWEAWENELSPYFMTISMDLPGHGLTGPDIQKRYGIEDYSKLVFGIADHLGLDEFHVAGNSMGGGVALKMASDQPDRILTLNLIDSSGARPITKTDSAQSKSYNSGAWIFRIAQNPVFNKLLLKVHPKVCFWS
jgi:pimeloyl-ACP methyl ester carboxylesterase